MTTPKTLTEIRDTLAEWDGLKMHTNYSDVFVKEDGLIWRDISGNYGHPYPATLDAAAEAMPDGWDWELDNHSGVFLARAWQLEGGRNYRESPKSDTAMEAVYRLAYACRLAEREGK